MNYYSAREARTHNLRIVTLDWETLSVKVRRSDQLGEGGNSERLMFLPLNIHYIAQRQAKQHPHLRNMCFLKEQSASDVIIVTQNTPGF
jgi:hypothetical protein